MSNPWLNLAIGGLKGAEANRQRRTDEEERKRKHEKEDLELRLRLAELAQNPDIEVSGFPYVDAATAAGPGAGGSPPAGPGLPAPAAPGMARRWRPDTGWQEAPTGKPEEARPVAAARAGPSTPFLDRAIELGTVKVGGQDVGIRVTPGGRRAREAASQRAAFQTLQDRYGSDKNGYPTFIPEFDYREELKTAAEEERRGEREAKIQRLRTTQSSAAAAAQTRRALAEDIAYDLFEQGGSLEEVQAAIAKDPQARGGLSAARARSIERDAARAAPDTERARQRITSQLGKVPTPMQGAAPIDAETQQDIIDALARGHTAEEILSAIGDPALAKTVQRWLKRGAQLRRPTAATGQP